MNLIETLEREAIDALTADKNIPEFRPGDTLRVGVKVIEGDRSRVQAFEGVCIARANKGVGSSFTVRKISFGEGVERVFPLYSPIIDKIEVVRRGDVRRAKLYYLRGRTGKAARIAERRDPRRDSRCYTARREGYRSLSPASDRQREAGPIGLRLFFLASGLNGAAMYKKFACLLLVASVAAPVWATDLPLERVFSSPSLSGPTPRKARLSPDGKFVTLLKNRTDDKERYDLWAIDTATGAQRMLVDSEEDRLRRRAFRRREDAPRTRAHRGNQGHRRIWVGAGLAVDPGADRWRSFLATLDGKVRRLTETKQTEIDPKVSETGRYSLSCATRTSS